MKKTKSAVPFEYNQKQVNHLRSTVWLLEQQQKDLSKLKDSEPAIAAIDKAIDALAVEYTKHLDALVKGRGQDDNFVVVEMFSMLKFKK